ERIPTDIYDTVLFHGKDSFTAWLPEICRSEFTTTQFREAVGINDYTARAILKVLQKAGIIEQKGKKGRCLLYSRKDLADTDSIK
ncbi:MAG: helix-turn-helix transcriptional regulator, partial [Clostridia bacterium]|nr:helix-turn-helix transcriptional regulator [Clostridia bacterium]